MKKSTCFVVMLGFLAGNACAQGLEFKGLQLGQPTTPTQIIEHLTVCGPEEGSCSDSLRVIADLMKITCGADDDGTQICNGHTTIVGNLSNLNVVVAADGRLQRIFLTFSNGSYDEVHDALLRKYGKPSSVKRYRVQNGFGAQFVQVDTIWHRTGGLKLRLSRYGASTDDSVVYFSTKADDDMLKRSGDSSDL